MLQTVGAASLDALVDEAIPSRIRLPRALDLPDGLSEQQFLRELAEVASGNRLFRSYIGLGYYDCFTPSVIRRNVFENPGWYTPYTPYQAEIAQGRLEGLLNFQTMVCDLTGMQVANASLLDEATAAAEAMTMLHRVSRKRAGRPRAVLRLRFLFSADARRASGARRAHGHRAGRRRSVDRRSFQIAYSARSCRRRTNRAARTISRISSSAPGRQASSSRSRRIS